MVAALFLVTRTVSNNEDKDGIRQVVINNDDGDADAVIAANAATAVNNDQPATTDAVNTSEKLKSDYFDTVVQIGSTPAGPLATDQDFIAVGDSVSEVLT